MAVFQDQAFLLFFRHKLLFSKKKSNAMIMEIESLFDSTSTKADLGYIRLIQAKET
jgi:hypothetical protein